MEGSVWDGEGGSEKMNCHRLVNKDRRVLSSDLEMLLSSGFCGPGLETVTREIDGKTIQYAVGYKNAMHNCSACMPCCYECARRLRVAPPCRRPVICTT